MIAGPDLFAGNAAADAGGVPEDWRRQVPVFASPRFAEVMDAVAAARRMETVYPAARDVFRALVHTPFERVRVVILGQDPYHGPGQAHGLAFSVPEGVPPPPSLRNILRELRDDVHGGAPRHLATDLTPWARQGVLLLNTSLTVVEGRPGAHARIGWTAVTDGLVRALAEHHDGLAFLLWGNHAQARLPLIDPTRHLVLAAAHPSPLSAHRGFFGCRAFSRVNAHLATRGQPPVRWG